MLFDIYFNILQTYYKKKKTYKIRSYEEIDEIKMNNYVQKYK